MANFTLQISQMTASEFKAFKKALTILMRAGMSNEDAIEVLVPLTFISREQRLEVKRRDTFARFNRESGYEHGK